MNLEYTLTFTEDELILLVQCVQAEVMKIHHAFYADNTTSEGNPTPLHSALMIRMMEEKTRTIVKLREQGHSF